ncbi:hypothetical protein ACJH6H_29330 [Mycobacterium sp. SMC-21]|uniref:hypothetical protein n=1 Tax=Mycobacterium sp. SMC-21 TaxID=3381632 RepID=UPI0038765C45
MLGIDVDDYISRGKTKRGLATIAEHENRYGAKLPDTYVTTAREGGSGIRWYRAPHDWHGPGVLSAETELATDTDPGVELIQRTHRYGIVGPSIHAETGQPYRLYGPDGALIADGLLPPPGELPELPDAWLDGLAAQYTTRALVGRLNRDEIGLWLDTYADNRYPHGLAQVVKRFHRLIDTGEKNRHNAMFESLCWALKESRVGGYPAHEAERVLRAEWLAITAGDPGHDEREFDNMFTGERGAIAAAEGDDEELSIPVDRLVSGDLRSS